MPQATAEPAPRNEIVLVGRLSAPPDTRVLTSGDKVTSFRVIVRREVPRRSARPAPPRAPVVDTVDCAAWTAALRKTVCGWEPGDVVEVHGALRRRFWRAAGGPASRYEVEVLTARRVRRADAGRDGSGAHEVLPGKVMPSVRGRLPPATAFTTRTAGGLDERHAAKAGT